MSGIVIDYTLATTTISNPDSSRPADVRGTAPTAGPGASDLGELPNALAFGPGASVHTPLGAADVSATQFCVRAVLRPGATAGRENLVEGDGLPFALFLEPGSSAGASRLVVSVANDVLGWSAISSVDELASGTWYTVSLVYDGDLLAVMVGDKVRAISAFPSGRLKAGWGNSLVIGSSLSRDRWHFSGAIAAVQVHSGIPEALEALVDGRRGTTDWFITWKYNSVRRSIDLGSPTGPIRWDASARVNYQDYERGRITHEPGAPFAFELHGAIYACYAVDADLRSQLGPTVSDEVNAPGGRKSAFQRGAIYWSGATGAVPVLGMIYASYSDLGEGGHHIGLPTAGASTIPNGYQQEFQRGTIYYRSGSARAFEVHGAIRERFLATGGVSTWGFPVSDETAVKKGANDIGRMSSFEGADFYWTSATGAHEVHGAIRARYGEIGGPTSDLGFPTSDETTVPGVPSARYNTFANGSIVWFGGPIFVCRPFRVYVGTVSVDDTDNDLLFYEDDTDLFLNVRVRKNGHQVASRRIPGSGSFGETMTRDVATELPDLLVPNDANAVFEVEFDVWDEDGGMNGDNDHLGKYVKRLDITNAWGFRDNAGGLFSTGGFSHVRDIAWSLKRQTTADTPFDFWGVTNRGTSSLSWEQYATTFSDVDPAPKYTDPIDGLHALYYELAYKSVADGGNCFGLSLEAIYAWKGRSRMSRPLADYTRWDDVRPDFNLKHGYQLGAQAIWWFVDQFVSGNTHSPKSVFLESQAAFARGENPVICIAQNSDFTGAPHCILPIAWHTDTTPWRIDIFDPNYKNSVKVLTVDPGTNRFTYEGGSTYSGGEWSGGRFHYMPLSVLGQRPRTPLWDILALLSGGLLLLLGSSAETEKLEDLSGNDLLAARDTSRAVSGLRKKFVPIRGTAGNPVTGEILVRMGRRLEHPQPAPAPRGAVTRAADRRVLDLGAVRPILPLGPQGFTHTVVGRASGSTNYTVVNGTRSLQLEFGVESGKSSSVSVTNEGSGAQKVEFGRVTDLPIRIATTARQAGGGDYLVLEVEGAHPSGAADPVARVAPGGTSVELVGLRGAARISIAGRVDGQDLKRTWSHVVDSGVRIVSSNLITGETLKVGRIDTLGAAARDLRHLKPNG